MSEFNQEQLLEMYREPRSREKAFSIIVKENQRPIYYFIRRMVLDHDDSDDIAQNTFIKAWKGLENFRGESKISTWLHKIAYNESISFINAQKRMGKVPLEHVEHSLSKSLEADVHYNGDEIQRKLQTAIALLPEKQKAVFVMKYFDEIKYEEMSSITGTSVGALKASFHHAVQKIEAFLKRD